MFTSDKYLNKLYNKEILTEAELIKLRIYNERLEQKMNNLKHRVSVADLIILREE